MCGSRNMRKAVSLSLLSALCATAAVVAAEELPHTRLSALSTEPALQIMMNGQVAAFGKQMAGRGDLEVAASVTNLLAFAARQAEAGVASREERQKADVAYAAAWEVALGARRGLRSPQGREEILARWETAFKEGGPLVLYQLFALWADSVSAGQLDRSLLTGSFWDLLRRTREPGLLSGFCVLLRRYGEAADVKPLLEKRDSGIPPKLQGMVQSALDRIAYRVDRKTQGAYGLTLDGRPTPFVEDPGPAREGSGRVEPTWPDD